MAVIWTELIKLLVCVGAQAGECARTASQRGLGFREEAMHQTYEILGRSWPMLVPAALFVMQQVLALPCDGPALQPWWINWAVKLVMQLEIRPPSSYVNRKLLLTGCNIISLMNSICGGLVNTPPV